MLARGAAADFPMTSISQTPLGRRRRLDAETARAVILDAAEEILREQGPDKLKLVDIAKRAKITHGNVVHHFGSITDVQQALAMELIDRLIGDVEELLKRDPVPGGQPELSGIKEAFGVFSEKGYARLIAWLILSDSLPPLDPLKEKVRHLIDLCHERYGDRPDGVDLDRQTVISIMRVVIMTAVGQGLAGPQIDELVSDRKQPCAEDVVTEMVYRFALTKADPGIR